MLTAPYVTNLIQYIQMALPELFFLLLVVCCVRISMAFSSILQLSIFLCLLCWQCEVTQHIQTFPSTARFTLYSFLYDILLSDNEVKCTILNTSKIFKLGNCLCASGLGRITSFKHIMTLRKCLLASQVQERITDKECIFYPDPVFNEKSAKMIQVFSNSVSNLIRFCTVQW